MWEKVIKYHRIEQCFYNVFTQTCPNALLLVLLQGIFHLSASVLMILTVLPITSPTPYHARNSSKKDPQINKESSTESINTVNEQRSQQSIYVKIASEKPQLPPWAVEPTEDNNLSRPIRAVQTPHIAESVCDSVSSWEEKEASEDMWGNPVRIVKNIQVGGTRMVQYFYETYCNTNSTGTNDCRGIDSNQYNSECETKHIWAYAQVRTVANETGWTHIKIRGSCNCSLFAKHARPVSIWEELLQLRR